MKKILLMSTALGTLPLPAAVILSNNFNNNAGDDTGPGFVIVSNGTEDNSVSNASTGRISFEDTGTGTPTVGFSSSSALDVSGAAGFTLTWAITSGNPLQLGSVNANGWFFGVQDGQGQEGVGGTLWNNVGNAIGINMRPGGAWGISTDPGSTAANPTATDLFGGANPTGTSINDGFTLSLTLMNDNSWTATSTGLSTNFNASGASLPGTVTYSDVASSLYVSTTLQSTGTPFPITSVTYDSVTLDTIVVPEPSGTILLGVSGMMFALRRRR